MDKLLEQGLEDAGRSPTNLPVAASLKPPLESKDKQPLIKAGIGRQASRGVHKTKSGKTFSASID